MYVQYHYSIWKAELKLAFSVINFRITNKYYGIKIVVQHMRTVKFLV